MTQEEKAKAYDEALEKAKRLYEQGTITESLAYIFPGLQESDGEKIREKIIATIHLYYGEPLEDEAKEMIAWLEKQGKPIYNVPSREVILAIWDLGNEWKELTNGCISTEYGTQLGYIQKHWEESEYYLREKRGKQKPNEKVKSKFKVKYAGSEYNVLEIKEIAGVTYYGIEDEPNHIDYILSDNCEIVRDHSYGVKEKGSPHPTRTAIFSEQKPAWSEEDEKMLNRLIGVLDGTNKEDYHEGWEEIFLPWLKSLKQRIGG